jgi:hypothetical protein
MVQADAAMLPNTANIQAQFQFPVSNHFLTFPCSTLNHSNCQFLWHKGKVFPVYAIYGKIQLYLHSFLSLALETGKWSTSHPREGTLVPISEKAGWVPEPVWTFKRKISKLIWTPDHPAHRQVTMFTMLLQLVPIISSAPKILMFYTT